MLQTLKIRTGAISGLIGAGVGMGVVFGALILGFSLIGAAGLFALMNNLVDFICGLLFTSSAQVVSLLILPVESFFSPECFLTSTSGFLSMVPVVCYSNADTQKVLILKENKGKSGVYRWVNLENGKSYIGSSVNLSRRLANYFSIYYLSSQSKSSFICKALLKYGYSGFSLEILEYCEKNEALEREQFYLGSFKPEYNILSTAGSSLGFKHTEETKAKLRIANVGIPKSVEHKIAISLSMPNSIKIKALDLKTNTETIYNSMGETARGLNISPSRITRYFSRNQIKPLNKRYDLKKIDQ